MARYRPQKVGRVWRVRAIDARGIATPPAVPMRNMAEIS
jgi:hypothetical protein